MIFDTIKKVQIGMSRNAVVLYSYKNQLITL